MKPKVGSKMKIRSEWYGHYPWEEGLTVPIPAEYVNNGYSSEWVFFKINECDNPDHNKKGYCGGADYKMYVGSMFEFPEEQQVSQQTEKQSVCLCPAFQLTWEGHNSDCPEKKNR